jgi:hypothetical protein
VLIVGSVLGLAYGSLSYTKETQEAELGPIELSEKEKADDQHSRVGGRGSDCNRRSAFDATFASAKGGSEEIGLRRSR